MRYQDMKTYIEKSFVYNITDEEKNKLKELPEKEFRKEIQSRKLFSELPYFLKQSRQLLFPVYTIWGRNE
eukprot:Pgem_evm1s3538